MNDQEQAIDYASSFAEAAVEGRLTAHEEQRLFGPWDTPRRREPEWYGMNEAERKAWRKKQASVAIKARNAVVKAEGLRPIGEQRWIDPETAKACKEMRLEMMEAREPTAQEMGLFFYLREPMLKDPVYLVAAWERGREQSILFERHDTIAAALGAMQQKWRAKRLEEMTGGSSEGFYSEW